MALAVGLPLREVAAALSAAAVGRRRWRMELHERADGLVVVNDAYNANPASMAAAVDALAAIGEPPATAAPSPCSARCSSSGDDARRGHREVGRLRRRAPASTSWSRSASPARGIADGRRGVDGRPGVAVAHGGA